jgi:uncharacterized protein
MKPGALLLTPGAGSDSNHSCLVAIEAAVAPLPVARIDFPYRKAGKRAPDKTPVLLDCVRTEAAALVERTKANPKSIVLGGRSMGGRMCSMAVADGLAARGLVLISYPLHPPGKPDKLRIEHLPAIEVPCLLIHGTNDPFATPEELTTWTKTITGKVTHVWIEKGTHDLRRKDEEVATAVAKWMKTLR